MRSNSNYYTEFRDHRAKHSDRHSKQPDRPPSSKYSKTRKRRQKQRWTRKGSAVAGTIAGVGTGPGRQVAQSAGTRASNTNLIHHLSFSLSSDDRIRLNPISYHPFPLALLSLSISGSLSSLFHFDSMETWQSGLGMDAFDRRGEERRVKRRWTGLRWYGRGGDDGSDRLSSFSSSDWLCIRLVIATVSFVHFLVFLLLVQLGFGFSTAFGHAFVEITFG
jgi:hypothetical protein